MNKKICIVVATMLMCTSALLILPEELNAGAISTEEIIFYFNSYDPNVSWETHYPGGGASTTIDGDVELLNGNTCPGQCPWSYTKFSSGTITKVELRVMAKYGGSQRDTILQPVFNGSFDGDNHSFHTNETWQFSPWFDITIDTNAPAMWTGTDVVNLDCKVIAEYKPESGRFTLYYTIVQIRVTHYI